MTSFKDEYMSVEHVIMALFEINENWVKDLLNQEGMNKKDTKKVILEIQPDGAECGRVPAVCHVG